MIGNSKPGRGSDGTAYIGSVPHALAFEAKARTSAAAALQRGQNEGYEQGHEDGYHAGYSQAIEVGNAQIRQQLEYTRAHVAEKDQIKAELARQRQKADNADVQIQQQLDLAKKHVTEKEQIKAELLRQRQVIDMLEVRVTALVEENQRLRQENGQSKAQNTGLQELIQSLRGAHERLQTQFNELDVRYKERTRQYADQLWQYNRAVVFMTAVGGVLEELTSEDSPQARRTRDLFVDRYAKEVKKGLDQGTIKMAPDVDPQFGKFLPRTRMFIADLLASASATKEIESTTEAAP